MTKYDLRQYLYLQHEIRQIKDEWHELNDTIISSPILNDMPKSTATSDPTAICALQLIALKKAFTDKRLEALEQLTDIENAIDNLMPLERLLIRERYIFGRSWAEVCKSIHYSNSRVHELHDIVLEKLKKVDSIGHVSVV